MVLGARCFDIPDEPFKNYFGASIFDIYGQEIRLLESQGLIERTKTGISVTMNGRYYVDINDEIVFEFSSHSSEQEFGEYRDRIRNSLRAHLKNHYFGIQIRFSEKEAENHILSKKEKFEKLSEKNPILLKLKEEFVLDLYE